MRTYVRALERMVRRGSGPGSFRSMGDRYETGHEQRGAPIPALAQQTLF